MDYKSDVGRFSQSPLDASAMKFMQSSGDISLNSESTNSKVRQTVPLISEYQLIEENRVSTDLSNTGSDTL